MIHSLSISCLCQHNIIRRRRHGWSTASSQSFSSISTSSQRDDSHHHHLQSSSSSIQEDDWRELFRSSDYDDAWSAYQPFFHSPTTSTTSQYQDTNSLNIIDTTHQKQIIPSILNNTWKRRQFGMNLQPLYMTYNNVNIEEYIDAQGRSAELDEQANQQQTEIETILNSDEVTKVQTKLQRIDIQTRFLCRMLDDLYRTGIWREIDRPRTERCHRAIGRLMTMTPENPPRRRYKDNAASNTQQQEELAGIGFTGLAQRAGAILHKLELCSPLALQRNKQAQLKKMIESTTDDNTAEQDIEQTASEGATKSYQGVYTSYPQHLSHTKFALPTPTSKIYNMVLLSYGKEEEGEKEVGSNGIHVPQQAEDVIWGMLSRVVQHQQQSMMHNNVEKKRSSSNSILYPTVENWNCVLSCWSRNNDTDKAFYAFSFLLSWMEWNKHIELNDRLLLGGSVGSDIISKPDMDSFYFVLQSCLINEFDVGKDGDDNSTDETKDARFQRAKEMGAGVAIRLWNEMQRYSNNDTSMEIDSIMYYEILQAICQSSELPSTKSSSSTTSRPLAALARVFTSCCKDGMNTLEIMNLVRDHTTESQFDQLKVKVATFL